MVCSCALAPFSQRCTLHHSSPAFRLPYASERRSSLVEVVEVVAVVLCEVAVDDRPGHECKHSSGPAPLAFTADRSGEALDLLPRCLHRRVVRLEAYCHPAARQGPS